MKHHDPWRESITARRDRLDRDHAGMKGFTITTGDGADGVGIYFKADDGTIHLCSWINGDVNLTTSVGQPWTPTLAALFEVCGITEDHCRDAFAELRRRRTEL